MKVEVVIPAAGKGLRMGGSIPKPLLKIGSRPILIHTLAALAENNFIKKVILAVNQNYLDSFRRVLGRYKADYGQRLTVDLVIGGNERKDSVKNCLSRLSFDTEIVLVHDAVRPFVDSDLVRALIGEALRSGAAIPGVPVKPTLKKITRSRCRGVSRFTVKKTIQREDIWETQTPQAFKREIIIKAYKNSRRVKVTDDAQLVERLGFNVSVVLGSYTNIKITTPEDLVFAEAIYKKLKK